MTNINIKYERGTTMRITAYFTDPDTGAYVDPTNPTCIVTTPDGTVKLSGAMAQLGTGSYQAECQTEFTDDVGWWTVKVYGTYGGKRVSETDKVQVVEAK